MSVKTQAQDSTAFQLNESEANLFTISMDDLLNIKVSVAGKTETVIRETPGIITVITKEELKSLPSRDLVDILRLVPGFEFASESDQALGLGVRGNYGLEGKVLVLLDGQQMNETGYGAVSWGNHFNPDIIQKIEIIRGPGSAIYGGVAELAVINIISETGKDIDGIKLSSSIGQSNNALSRTQANFAIGNEITEDLTLSLSGNISEANRSNEQYNYASWFATGESTSVDYADSSEIKSLNLNLGAQYKNLDFRFIYDSYKTGYLDYPEADHLDLSGIYSGIKYTWEINDKFSIIPQINFKLQQPWEYGGDDLDSTWLIYKTTARRFSESITAIYTMSDQVQFLMGYDGYQDRLTNNRDFPLSEVAFLNGEYAIDYYNHGIFGELKVKNKIANFIIGARFDNHSRAESAFVPRLAITKQIKNFHSKLLLSKAFKAPVVQNFEYDPNIKPERTSIIELEIGQKINDQLSATLNTYFMEIDDPIIFYYDANSDFATYNNLASASTAGIESEVKYKNDWGAINLGYSYYRSTSSADTNYVVDSNKQLHKGFPQHKVTLSSFINLNDKLTVGTSLIATSERISTEYRAEFWDDFGEVTYPSTFILNANIKYNIIENLSMSVSVFDLFNSRLIASYHSAYGYTATPLMGREFVIKSSYKF